MPAVSLNSSVYTGAWKKTDHSLACERRARLRVSTACAACTAAPARRAPPRGAAALQHAPACLTDAAARTPPPTLPCCRHSLPGVWRRVSATATAACNAAIYSAHLHAAIYCASGAHILASAALRPPAPAAHCCSDPIWTHSKLIQTHSNPTGGTLPSRPRACKESLPKIMAPSLATAAGRRCCALPKPAPQAAA